MSARRRRGFGIALLLSLSAGLPGCRGCGEDKPYTPFGVASTLPDATGAAAAPPPSAAWGDAGATVEKSVFAPRGATRWQLGGKELAAPEGLVFEQGLVADFDDDGAADSVVWLVPDGDAGAGAARGEAWFFPGRAAPRRLTGLPGFVPTGPSCTITTALARTGPHTATLDAKASCENAVIQRSPVRGLVVLAPPSERAEVLVLRAAAAAPDETLELSATTVDRDGDGRDDVEVHVAVGSPGVSALDAPFVWLDRAVGPSRDTAEPRKTLERLASREAARAKQKKVADDVIRRVGAIRRLLGTLCFEAATARVFDGEGAGLGCGTLTNVVDSLAAAEIGAELARGHVLEAFGAFARDGWYFGRMSSAMRKRLEKQLLDAVKPLSANVSFVDVRPLLPTTPHYSPLYFEHGGELVVRTQSGLVKVARGETNAVPVEMDAGEPSALEVLTATGVLLTGIAYSCDRSDITLLVREKFWSAGKTAPIPTGFLAPRPGTCARTLFEPSPGLSPIGAAGPKLTVLLGGSIVGDLAASTSPPGSARSADGKWIVSVTPHGLLLAGAEARLLTLGLGAPAPSRLSDCVPSEDGLAAACVADGKVLVAVSP